MVRRYHRLFARLHTLICTVSTAYLHDPLEGNMLVLVFLSLTKKEGDGLPLGSSAPPMVWKKRGLLLVDFPFFCRLGSSIPPIMHWIYSPMLKRPSIWEKQH